MTTAPVGVVARAGVPVLYPMTAVRDVEDCYRVTHVDAPEDAPASSKENSPLWRAVAQAQGEAALSERVSLLSAVASKGLEFDSVILVEPAEILGDGVGDLFVALTRATHDVHVVHCAPLPAGMEEW